MNIPEIQLVQYTSTKFPVFPNGNFKLSFGPSTNEKKESGQFSNSTSPFNIRSELINLGYANGGFATGFAMNNPIGDVRVSRSIIPDKGYGWSVTFVSSENQGDQVSLMHGYSLLLTLKEL